MSDTPIDAIISAGEFLEFLETFQAAVGETTLHVQEDGIYGQPVEPGNVVCINQTLSEAAFESYYADPFRIGINLERLNGYVSKAGKDDRIHLTLDNESRKLEIDIGTADFSMAGIDPDAVRNGNDVEDTTTLDKMCVDVTLDGAALSHGVDVAGMMSNHMTFAADPDWDNPVHLVVEGDTDEVTVRFGDSLHDGSTVDEAAESMFSEDYFSNLVSVIPDDSAVRVRAGDEWPLRLDYEYADGDAEVKMLLAPRVQTH